MTPSRFRQPTRSPPTTASYPMAVSHPVSQSCHTPQPVPHNSPSTPGTFGRGHLPTVVTPTNDQPDPSGYRQSQRGSDSETDFQPRFSAAEKGKRPVTVASWVSMSEDEEEEPPLGEMMGESATPAPYFAEVNGLLQLNDGLPLTILIPGSPCHRSRYPQPG